MKYSNIFIDYLKNKFSLTLVTSFSVFYGGVVNYAYLKEISSESLFIDAISSTSLIVFSVVGMLGVLLILISYFYFLFSFDELSDERSDESERKRLSIIHLLVLISLIVFYFLRLDMLWELVCFSLFWIFISFCLCQFKVIKSNFLSLIACVLPYLFLLFLFRLLDVNSYLFVVVCVFFGFSIALIYLDVLKDIYQNPLFSLLFTVLFSFLYIMHPVGNSDFLNRNMVFLGVSDKNFYQYVIDADYVGKVENVKPSQNSIVCGKILWRTNNIESDVVLDLKINDEKFVKILVPKKNIYLYKGHYSKCNSKS